jgi:hypothetical protein
MILPPTAPLTMSAATLEAGIAVLLTGRIFYSLDHQLGDSIFAKANIAIGRWVQKHLYRIFRTGENRSVFEYDKIRNISHIIVGTIASDIIALVCIILIFRMEHDDYIADDLLVHIPLIGVLILLWLLYAKTTRVCNNYESEIEFLKYLERAQRASKGVNAASPFSEETDMTPEGIIKRLAKLSPPSNSDERREYAKLQGMYAKLRLNSEGTIETVLNEAERKFDKRWAESKSLKADH